jgi:hypothetical protein
MKWKIILISLIVLLVVSLIFSIAVLVHANSSQWYFRDTNASTGPTAKASTDTDSFPSVPAGKNTPKDMSATKGTAQTSVAGAYVAANLYTMVRIFVGPALYAQTLTGGQAGYKVAVGTQESSTSMNKYQRTFVYIWRSGSGNVKTIVTPTSCGTEHTTAERGCVITAAGAAGDFSILTNDRIVVEIWWDLRDATTSYTATLYYNGTTDPTEGTATSNAASYFYCPQTLNLYTPPTNDGLTLDLTGASYKSTKTLLCAKQDYKFVYLCSDTGGVTDITYAQIQLDPTGRNVTLRATRGLGDAWTFSENSDPTNYVTLNVAGSSHSTSGNQKTFNFLVTINWNWGDSAETVTVRCYVIDASSASDQDDYTNIFGVECHLTSASLSVSDYRVNPSQTSLTFSGYWYYDGTTIAPPDGNYAALIKLSGVQKGSTDTTLVSGAFSINDVTTESTVNSYSYTVEATYMSGAGSFSAVIVDRIKVLSYTVSDSRANINDNVNIDATLIYESDSTAITTGTITINGYSASHIGSGVYRITRTSASVTSVTYNTVAGSESTYGLTTVNQNSQSTTVIWDRIRVDSLGLTDSRINANGIETSTLYATASLEYGGHTLGSGDSLTISGIALSWNAGNSRFEGTTATSSSVASTTYNAFTSGNEATYGITVGNINSQTVTLIFDKLQVQSYTVVDNRVNINDNVNIDALIWFDFDNTVCTTGTITINGFAASHQGSGVYRITRTSASVTSVIYNTVACSAETTYGITTVDQNAQSTIVIWDRIKITELGNDDERRDTGTTGTFWATAVLEYDNHALDSGDSLTISGKSMTWNAGNNRFETTDSSSTVQAKTYNTFSSGNEMTYGITAGTMNGYSTTIIWDKFEFVSVTADDTRINVGGTFELRYQIRYDYDDVTFDSTKGSITGFTWDLVNSWWDKAVTGSSSVTSTNYDEAYVSISDTTYGIIVKQDVAGVDVITDRIKITGIGNDDSRRDISTTGTFWATAVLEYDSHALGSGDSLTIQGKSMTWVAGNSRFEATDLQSTVQSVTYNTFTSGNEATYEITAGTMNGYSTTIIWDRIGIYEKDEPITVQSVPRTESLPSETFSMSTFSILIFALSFLLLSFSRKGNKRPKILCSILILLFLVPSLCFMKPVLASNQTVLVDTYVMIWFKARYDYDNASYTNQSSSTLLINETLATYNATGGYWQLNVTQSVAGNYTYLVTAISDGVYGLTTFYDAVGAIKVEWSLGYNLNLRVKDYNMSDAISGAVVTMNNGTDYNIVSDSNGWANYTLVTGTVAVKVSYFGFYVNGTFSISVTSDTTIDIQCNLYDVTVTVKETVQDAILCNANVTVLNSTSEEVNKIKSGITNGNGQVVLTNLPNNTLTFTRYGGLSYSIVIGNSTQLVSSENQNFTITADQNYVNTNNSYSIIAFAG